MNVHELTLQNYTAASGCPSACQPILYLGTAGSYGNEQINVVLGEGWQGLTVKAVFQPSGVPVVVPDGGGVISVPWEATQSVVAYPNGRISFQGYVSGRLVNTSDVPYTVGGSSAGSDNTPAPTPDEFQQFLDAVKSDADRAAQAAADAEAAVQKVTNAGTQAVTDIDDAKTKALTALTDEGAAQKKAVTDAGKKALDDLETARRAAETGLTETGNTQKQAVQDAGTTALKQVNTAGQTQTDRVNKAGEDKLAQIDAVNAHPPIVQGGTWWTWDTASGAYTDTGLTAEGKDGNVLFATFAVDPATGLLSMTTPDGYAGPEFTLNNGYLEVTVNA